MSAEPRTHHRCCGAIGLAALVCIAALGFATPTAVANQTTRPLRLAHGHIGDFRWSVEAEAEPSENPKRPCISTISAGGGVTVCGALEPQPLLLGDSTGRGDHQRTILALAFPPQVVAVRLWLRHRRSRLVRLRLLGMQQSARLGLDRFRYAGRAFAGDYCLRRFIAYDRSFDPLSKSGRMKCPR